MTKNSSGRPVSRYDDSHISKDAREKIESVDPEIRRRVLAVADADKNNPKTNTNSK
jgi:hypothetical protein